MDPLHPKGVVVQAGARRSDGGEDPRGDGDEGVVLVLDGDLGCVAVVVLPQVDLESGATELHVSVPHPPGEPAVPKGAQGAGLLVKGPFPAAKTGVRLLVDRGELVQAIEEVFLEHLDQQGEPDFSTGQPG